MTQILRVGPASNNTGGWRTHAGSSASIDLAGAVSEEERNDATYIQGMGEIVFPIDPPPEAPAMGMIVVPIAYAATLASAPVELEVELLQGGALLAGGSALMTGIGTDWTLATVTVPTTGVTSWGALSLRLTAAPAGTTDPGGPGPGEWPITGADIEVFPGDDLAAIVGAASAGSDIYLHRNLDGTRHTYTLSAPLAPANEITLRTAPPARTLVDAARDVWALQPWVRIDAGGGHYVFDLTGSGRHTWTIENLHISGARYSGSGNNTGVGIRGGNNVTVRWCLITDCDNQGAGQSWQGVMEHVEITDCSGAQVGGSSGTGAAAKSPRPCTYTSCYVHHNHYYGLWADCDNRGWVVRDCVVTDNYGSGVFYEISQGAALIEGTLVARNNLSNVNGRGGMIITSSRNVTIRSNVFVDNLLQSIRIWEDARFQNGPSSCTSGFYLQNILVEGNQRLSGPPIRLLFRDQSNIIPSTDGVHPNPHPLAPPGSAVTFTGNEY